MTSVAPPGESPLVSCLVSLLDSKFHHCKCTCAGGETDAAAAADSSGAARGQSLFQFHVLAAVWLWLTRATAEAIY